MKLFLGLNSYHLEIPKIDHCDKVNGPNSWGFFLEATASRQKTVKFLQFLNVEFKFKTFILQYF